MFRSRAAALRGAVVFLTVVAALPAAAQNTVTPALDLEQAQTLIAEGRPLDAFLLLEPFEGQYAGDLTYDYLLARAALDSGNPSRASFIYERILAVEPNYVGVRLESGRAYLELENYARAKQEFDIVLRIDNLPPDLRQAAEQYARVAEERLHPKKTFFSFYGEYGFGYDDNVNSSLSEAIVPLPGDFVILLDDLSVKRSSFYHSLNAGGQVVHRLTDNWNVFTGADYRGHLHVRDTIFDFHDVEGRVGVGYATGSDNVRLSGRYGRFWLNDDAIRDVSGLTLDWLHALDDRNQVNTTATYSRFRFKDRAFKVSNFDSYGLAGAWNHAFAEGKALVGLSVNVGVEDALGGRLDGDAILGGLNLSLQASLSKTIGAFLFLGAQRVNYADRNVLFQEHRHDRLFSATGGVSWSFAAGWSLRPQVSLSKNLSNIPLNTFDRMDVSLNLRKDF